MKPLLYFCFLILSIYPSYSQDYYSFPDTGWTQTQLFEIHDGISWSEYVIEFSYVKDSVINGITYKTIRNNSSEFFTRQENGKLYSLRSQGEELIYDFSLEVGDTLEGSLALSTQVHTVINKIKIAGPQKDSLWYMEIQVHGFWPDTIRWLEGIGNLQTGLFRFFFPDAGYRHICTRNRYNQTIYANPTIPVDCNCDYLHGVDADQDGYRNHLPIVKVIVLNEGDWPPAIVRETKHRTCDSLIIINETGQSVYINNTISGEDIWPDSATGMWEALFFSPIHDTISITINHQFVDIYYEINLFQCEVNDCDDEDSTVHPGHVEIPYNHIDNDCDPNTPDDDLDGDGFHIDSDCDDNNPDVNPSQAEIPYNGLDDDCNPTTLEDDLDQDGFGIASDCNDENENIYPGAPEIPNNGIDEDCDGNDLTTVTHQINEVAVYIYPNPATDFLVVSIDELGVYNVQVLNMIGEVLLRQDEIGKLDISQLANGIYLLQIDTSDPKISVFEKIIVLKD